MCLYIDKDVHQKNGSFLPPLSVVADRPLVVWKRLLSRSGGNPSRRDSSAISPYLNHVWVFGVEQQVTPILYGHRRDYRVDIGLHAYTAVNLEQATRRAGFRSRGQLFPAIIPTGARFYCGVPHEVASSRLIVYRNMKELLNAHDVKSLGHPVHRLNLGHNYVS